MAAFDELDFTAFDFDAIVVQGGITVVDAEHRESCLASLRRQSYAIESIDFRQGIGPAYLTMNDLFRWEENFGYQLRWHEGSSLDALRDGFEFDLQPGEGKVLELRGADDAYREDSYFFLCLLAIAHEYSLNQLALGARFFTVLFLDRGSPLIWAEYEKQIVPDFYVIHPKLEDPFLGWPEAPPGTEPSYAKLPVASSWESRAAAPVVFPIGDRPAIPADDAVELAELLNQKGMTGDSLAAVVLAAKIREQAGIFPNGQPLPDDWETEDFELAEHELIALSQVLAAEPWPKSRLWFEHFQYEVNRQIGLAD
jgi:hypothetical protein